MAISAEERRARLRQRTQESSNDRGQRGLGRALKVPLDLELANQPIVWYSLTADPRVTNMIDIIPFEITNPKYQHMRQFTGKPTRMAPGDWDYKLEIPVHQRVGGSDITLLCLREAFGEPCDICNDMFEEYRKKGTAEFNEKLAKSLQPQWRCVYKVYDYRDQKHTGFKLWDMAYKSFEEYLMEKAQTSEEGLVVFSDIWDGRVLEIEGRTKQIGKNDFIEPVSIRFLKRQEPYTEQDVLELPLDKMLIIPTPQEVCEIYYGMGNSGSDSGGDYRSDSPPADTPPPRREAPPARRDREDPPAQNECMMGGVLGRDLYKWDACQDKCPDDIFQKCSIEHDRLSPPDAGDPLPSESPPVDEPSVRRAPPSAAGPSEFAQPSRRRSAPPQQDTPQAEVPNSAPMRRRR